MSILDVLGKKTWFYILGFWILAVILFIFFMVIAFQPKTEGNINQQKIEVTTGKVTILIILNVIWKKEDVTAIQFQIDPYSHVQCTFSPNPAELDKNGEFST